MAGCTAVYALMVVTNDGSGSRLAFSQRHLVEWGGVYADRLREGEWWRLFTAMFVHATPEHFAFNMLALVQLGRYLEPRYGFARFVAVYVVCGVASSAVSAAWYWDRDVVQIGASGAIMALIGAGTVSALRMGSRGRVFRNSMLVWSIVTIVNGVLYSANNAAHLAGFATGALAVAIGGRRGRAALVPREPGGPMLDDAIGPPCAACDAPNPPGSRFCGACGVPLGATAATPAP